MINVGMSQRYLDFQDSLELLLLMRRGSELQNTLAFRLEVAGSGNRKGFFFFVRTLD